MFNPQQSSGSASPNKGSAMSEKPRFDASGLRIVMEHMLHYQQLNLDSAAACFVLYATGLVFDHCGKDRAQAVLDMAQTELQKQAQKSKHKSKPKSN